MVLPCFEIGQQIELNVFKCIFLFNLIFVSEKERKCCFMGPSHDLKLHKRI